MLLTQHIQKYGPMTACSSGCHTSTLPVYFVSSACFLVNILLACPHSNKYSNADLFKEVAERIKKKKKKKEAAFVNQSMDVNRNITAAFILISRVKSEYE